MAYYSIGSTGPGVLQIQQALLRTKSYLGPLNSNFTKKTAEAVSKYQREKNLTIDGAVGPDTWASLFPGQDYVEPDQSEAVEDTRFRLFGRHYITLGLILSIVPWAVLSTYTLTRHIEVEPLQKEADETQRQVSALNADNQRLANSYASIQKQIDLPTLRAPQNDTSLIGNDVEFAWEHPNDGKMTRYIFELRNPKTNQTWLLNVPTASTHKFFYTFSKEQLNAEYLWRVRKGSLQETIYTARDGGSLSRGSVPTESVKSDGDWNPNGLGWTYSFKIPKTAQTPNNVSGIPADVIGQIAEGEWSPYGDFRVFSDAMKRIATTGQVLVGVSPTSYGLLSTIDHEGRVEGFEEDLARLLAQEFGGRLHTHVDVHLVFEEWDQLLPSLDKDELDMVIASVTDTRQREAKFHIGFSRGYFQVHEVLIAMKSDEKDHHYSAIRRAGRHFERSSLRTLDTQGALADKVVAVNHETTNERAAKYLNENKHSDYGFKIDSHYQTIEEIYQALKTGEVDYALVDDVAMLRHYEDEKSICRVRNIEADLGPFYRKELSDAEKGEEYAVAVSDRELLKTIDEIMKSKQSEIDEWTKELRTFRGAVISPTEGPIPLCESNE